MPVEPTRVIERERIPSTDPRLGRSINHDSESRRFAYRPRARELRAIRHQRRVGIFDQLDLGRCVPTSALGCLGTGSYFDRYTALPVRPYELSDAGAIQAYRDVTRIDPFPGAWEPDDTGSDGLSMGKLLTAKGAIPGYEHAFGFNHALAALMDVPFITGTYWKTDMFYPTREGLVRTTGRIEGGHEYIVDEYDPVRGWIGFTNSWSASWGVGGRFYMEAEAYGALLAQDGDVTIFTLPALPPPTPEPAPVASADEADRALWADPKFRDWAGKDKAPYRKARAAARAHRDAKGL